ncbi:hypothetical protein BIT28_07435 [Photobacterium proteolyticum]|uniref:Uncharacterized protein n=1 Tax=Photobacterium proteolyticum TaxID=1903952 RepID=A0A1Q9H7F1_9GAMM|nr:hypothetical protein [Photobacterium proteolyticum]OLQ83794.1 hypothetical protein BIT28_07435 [Photobacterium proteolyticum]
MKSDEAKAKLAARKKGAAPKPAIKDPALVPFLNLLEEDIEKHPEKLIRNPSPNDREIWGDFFEEEPCPDFPDRAEQTDQEREGFDDTEPNTREHP